MSAVPVRTTSSVLRAVLWTASVLVFVAGFQTYVLADSTDRFFAWTIVPPLSAAFIGAAFWSSCLLEVMAARQRRWANARIAVFPALVFSTLTLLATLLHLDRFHLRSPDAPALVAAWAWLVVYIAVPPLILTGFMFQVRVAGPDPLRQRQLPVWVLCVLSVQTAVFALVGLALFIAPQATLGVWPWTLTPLTARAIAAWLLGMAVSAGESLREHDYERISPAATSYALLGVLQVIALARYPGDFQWRQPAGWMYLVLLASVLAVSAGTLLGGRAKRTGHRQEQSAALEW